jgi:L-threonylcarbamoyladenylate synthase
MASCISRRIVVPDTRIIPVDADHPDPLVIDEAARILRNGGLVAFATETVYGLGADATNPSAVAGIFAAKGRPSTNPLIVHVQDKIAAYDCVAIWPDRAELLADRFWPGPLTLVLPRSKIIPDIVTAGQDTVGVRVPNLGVARWLILEAGRPIAAPSANRSMGVSPTQAKHVYGDLNGKVDLILDSGPTTIGIESTVLDLSGETPRILRPGEVTAEQIAEVLGEPVESGGHSTGPAKSPGQMAVHYAPRTPAYRMERDQICADIIPKNSQVWIFGDEVEAPIPRQAGVIPWSARISKPEVVSRELYTRLHQIDSLGLDLLIIIPPPDEPRWRAIRDRIWRATQPWPGKP